MEAVGSVMTNKVRAVWGWRGWWFGVDFERLPDCFVHVYRRRCGGAPALIISLAVHLSLNASDF
jgi:hypothetical protein